MKNHKQRETYEKIMTLVTCPQIMDSVHLSVQQKFTYTETDEQTIFSKRTWFEKNSRLKLYYSRIVHRGKKIENPKYLEI